MIGLPGDSAPSGGDAREDRTRRALELVVGADYTDVALTHFVASRVTVCVHASDLNMPNAMLASVAALNMLGRFVGVVEVAVVGVASPEVEATLDVAIEKLGRIDSRTGRRIFRTADGAAVDGDVGDRIWIGDPNRHIANRAQSTSETNIYVAFDGWTCALRRGASAGPVIASTVPFGALTAMCFAVAEVFKNLAASAVPLDSLAMFRRRFVHDWRFSAWNMERIVEGEADILLSAPSAIPPLALHDVLQVGAGAVGNATALAFTSTPTLFGELSVLDIKCVDATNLNRCFYFTEDDVAAPKVDVLERSASRADLRVRGRYERFAAASLRGKSIILSTVDNNEVRHRMQEALPDVLVEGATGGTVVAVGVHTPGNGRSCLVCRHPDPNLGVSRRVPLSLVDTAGTIGLTEHEIASGKVAGDSMISDEVISRVAACSAEAATVLGTARSEGRDLCGALGELRAQLGTVSGPREASVPFVSNLAGVLAAAEVVKLLMRAAGTQDVPVLENIVEIDLARDYSRNSRLAFREPPRSDCALCQERLQAVTRHYARRRWV